MINVNQITSQLAKMPDQALQQYAAMHKNDPYMVTLALSESNRRKQMRARRQMPAQQQPKVVDQELADMAAVDPMGNVTGYAGGGYLPEDSGIGQLPAQNMQNMAGGGIVAFDEGGDVPGYAEGVFATAKKKYKQMKGYEFEGGPEMFEKALDAEGVKDPKQRAFLKAVHAQESDQALNAPTRDKSGATGPMQVTKDAWTDVSTKGSELKNRADPFENMRAGIRYASTGWQKSGGDPVLAGAYYYGGPGGLAKAQKGESVASSEDKGQTTFQYGNDVANRMKSFLPKNITPGTQAQAQAQTTPPKGKGIAALTASGDYSDPGTGFSMPQDVFSPSPEEERKYAAAQAQAKKVGDVVNQIPGQTSKAPAYKDENTYFGGLADQAGIPLEAQRNISNAINATSGITAPIGRVNRAASGIAKGLEPTAEMIQKAEQAAQVASTPRLLPPAKAGLEALDETSAATRAVAENARRMRQLEEDRKAATGAQQSVEAATKTANIADKTAQEIAVAQDAARLNQAKMTGAAQGLAGMQAIDKAGGIPDLAAAQPAVAPPTTAYTDEATRLAQRYPAPEATEEAGLESLLPTAEAPKKGGTDWNDFMIKMGLNLMASKDPNAISGTGQAGLATLGMQQAEEKAKSEAAYREAMGKHATMPSASIQELEWARDPKNMKLLRQIAQAKADPKTSAQEALAFLKDAGVVLKETDPVLYNVLRNKVLGGAVPQIQDVAGTRS